MRRGITAWAATLLLAVVGSQVAHGLDYRLVKPHEHEREELLASTGHAYLAYAPLALALLLGVLLAVLVTEARRPTRGHTASRTWAFGLVAPAVFVAQEHLERYAHDGVFPWSASLETTFLLGLLLQAPFAVAACLLARVLLRAARAIGRVLVDTPLRSHAVRTALSAPRTAARAPRVPALAHGYGERGPPGHA